ncbi:Arm DNA-binding domain-containing protein [Lysobacter enzymogenes]|uniref:Arm DNA-binding domain-containing protein n=1 Tax=Lysobacter enzymogenes TaxID=69 RepID=UPI0037491785
MAANTGKLTALAIKNAKPADKPVRLFDGGGLYLEVMPNGSRYWRLKYRFGGKEKRLALGVFPEVSLAVARDKRDTARTAIRNGIDPSAQRKADRRQALLATESSFSAVADEWLARQAAVLVPVTHRTAS